MKEEELKRLIEKYYNGESTEEEEGTLRDFFRKNNIPRGYEAEKEIFSYYAELVEIPEPSHDFEAQSFAAIDASERGRTVKKVRRYLLPILSAAAGLLILAGSYFLINHRDEQRDTFSDPKIAYAETMRILKGVSSQMNRGAQVLEPMGKINEIREKSFETLYKPTRIVEKNLKNLVLLQKAVENTKVPDKKIVNK
jgi:hypothetical protein